MPDQLPVFQGAFRGPNEQDDQGPAGPRGRRPVIFDILAPDQRTSLLPGDLKMVLHVNPRTMRLSYTKQINRVQTRGGFVEFHWGDGLEEINFENATGGFMRMYTGLSNVTGARGGTQGRRQTLAYERYLDLLALFHNNGAVYDANGNIVIQGFLKITFDGGVHIGWFDGQFTVTEDANQPFMFNMTSRFIIDKEIMEFRSPALWDFTSPSVALTSAERQQALDGSTALLDPLNVGGPSLSNTGLLGRANAQNSEEDFF